VVKSHLSAVGNVVRRDEFSEVFVSEFKQAAIEADTFAKRYRGSRVSLTATVGTTQTHE
jgi:hypothetical protein